MGVTEDQEKKRELDARRIQ